MVFRWIWLEKEGLVSVLCFSRVRSSSIPDFLCMCTLVVSLNTIRTATLCRVFIVCQYSHLPPNIYVRTFIVDESARRHSPPQRLPAGIGKVAVRK